VFSLLERFELVLDKEENLDFNRVFTFGEV